MGYDTLVSVKKATNGKKDYTAIFRDSKTGKEKKTHFGDATMDHYNIHKDKNRREKYRSRHKKDLNTGDPTRAGYLSYYLLWGESTSLRTNLAAFRKRFFPKSAKSPTKKTSSKRKMNGPGKPSSDTGLGRWFKEDWRDEEGNVCGSSKNKTQRNVVPKTESPKAHQLLGMKCLLLRNQKLCLRKNKLGWVPKLLQSEKAKSLGRKRLLLLEKVRNLKRKRHLQPKR